MVTTTSKHTGAPRWVRKYKIFFLLGIVTVIFQIYLAAQFFTITTEEEAAPDVARWSPNKRHRIDSETSVNSNNNNNRKLPNDFPDDEDSPNSQKTKHRSSNIKTNNDSNKIIKLGKNELDFQCSCEIDVKEAVSAIKRAKTRHCKQLIANVTCLDKENKLYPKYLPHECPARGKRKNKPLGCFKDEKSNRILEGFYAKYDKLNTPIYCINKCLQSGFPYAGVQYSNECFCGMETPSSASKLADSSCNMKCSGNSYEICGGFYTMNVYETGIVRPLSQSVVTDISTTVKKVKVVFLLTLNGRALRQVKRLIKILMHENVFFYIHVDVRQDYLFRELLSVEKKYGKFLRLTRNRYSTIWGGASLLTMLMSCMKELLKSEWSWDFIINLSESDYPVKRVEKLISFLSMNSDKNFVKSHGGDAQRFLQKQGLDKSFVECEGRMWRVGDRKLPEGVIIDGGSDWVALSRPFVEYVAAERPKELVKGLLKLFQFTLLPAESFFHTVLKNSRFCDRIVDNNLHVTNWKRKLGCKCQYKHIVDWCGCSPNDFKPEDWQRIQNTEKKNIYFARKFEPVINQAIVLQLEKWLLGSDFKQLEHMNGYWQTIHHYQDLSPIDDVLLTVSSSIIRIKAEQLKCEHLLFYKNNYSYKIIEVTSYHLNDNFMSNLVLFELTNGERFEVSYKPKNLISIRKLTRLTKRLEQFIVSSDFDPKERISRNFGRILGPYSEPVLIYSFGTDTSTLKSNNINSNISFVWIDPVGIVQDVITSNQLDENYTLDSVKPNLKKPLLPGFWTVDLIDKKDVLIRVKFLVAPLEYVSGRLINEEQVRIYNSGVPSYDKKDLPSEWNDRYSSSNQVEKDKLKRISLINALLHGNDLKKLIDEFVNKSYWIGELCLAQNSNYSCLDKAPLCNNTNWSSLTSDPKSNL